MLSQGYGNFNACLFRDSWLNIERFDSNTFMQVRIHTTLDINNPYTTVK